MKLEIENERGGKMFSVILPVYNSESTISQVLESVVKQSRRDLIDEIIIVNDGSTDSTDSCINEFIKHNKNFNIKYLRQTNCGVSFSRNRGIKNATGEWIALLDSDDLWLPNKLEIQLKYIKENSNIAFLGSDENLKFIFKKKTRKKIYKLSPKELCIRSTPIPSSVVFKREIGENLGLFSENMSHAEDINFFQKFLLLDSYYISIDKLVSYGFNRDYHGQSGLSSNLYKMHHGRQKNTKELYKMGLISKPFQNFMLIFNELKFIRRFIIVKISSIGKR